MNDHEYFKSCIADYLAGGLDDSEARASKATASPAPIVRVSFKQSNKRRRR